MTEVEVTKRLSGTDWETGSATGEKTAVCKPPNEKMPQTIYMMIGKGRGLTLAYGAFVFLIQFGLITFVRLGFTRNFNLTGEYNGYAKLTQPFAIIAFFILAQNCMTEVFDAIRFCPNPCNKDQWKNNNMLFIGCLLRFWIGLNCVYTNAVLILSKKAALSIVLSVTTVETISRFDEAGFNVAKSGRYWLGLQQDAERIANMDVPDFASKSSDSGRFRKGLFRVFEVTAFAAIMAVYALGVAMDTTVLELVREEDITSLRVQFPMSSGLMDYSGCYVGDESMSSPLNHFNISDSTGTETEARLGYCQDDGDGRWVFFTNTEDPCDADAQIARSKKMKMDGVSTAFFSSVPWYTASDTSFQSFFALFEVDDVCKSLGEL